MGFPKDPSNKNGMNKNYGNAIPADENSNKVWQGPGKTVGNIKGRLSFSKSNISDLNTGEWGVDVKTKAPGKNP
jgi:hypothetical protein